MLDVFALIVAVDCCTLLVSEEIAHNLGSLLDASLAYLLYFDFEDFKRAKRKLKTSVLSNPLKSA